MARDAGVDKMQAGRETSGSNSKDTSAYLGPYVLQILRHLGIDTQDAADLDAPLSLARWASDLSPALSRAGLSMGTYTYSIREVIRYAEPNSVFLTCVKGDAGEARVLAVRPAARGRVWVTIIDSQKARRKKISAKELAEHLDLGSTAQTITWGLLEHMRPLEALKTPAGSLADPIKRLKQLIRLEGYSIRAVIVYALFVGVLTLATPLAVQSLVNTIAFGTLVQPLVVLTLLLLAGLFVAGGLHVLETVVLEYLQRRIFVRTASDTAHRLSKIDLAATQASDLRTLTNYFLDVGTLQKVSSSLLLDGLGLVLQTAVGLVVLAFYHPLLLALDAVLVTFLAIILRVVGRRAVKTAISESKAKYAVLAWLEDMAATTPWLRVSRRRAAAIARADHLTHRYLTARERHFSRVLRQIIGLVVLQAVASAGLLGLGGWLVIRGQLTLGQLVASELIVTAVVGSMSKFGKHLADFYAASAAVDKLGHLIDLPLAKTKRDVPHVDTSWQLKASNVSLMSAQNKEILRGLRFSIGSRECVAVCGASGSGKSLLLSALAGVVEPSQGDIRLGSHSLKVCPKMDDWVCLLDEISFISGTLLDNIRFYGEGIPEADVMDAWHALGGGPFLAQFPDGIHTQIGGTGKILPHDLKVLICLARAWVHRPRILLIDGLLDGVSPTLKEAVLGALSAKSNPCSYVIATHCQEVVGACDKVLRLSAHSLEEVRV